MSGPNAPGPNVRTHFRPKGPPGLKRQLRDDGVPRSDGDFSYLIGTKLSLGATKVMTASILGKGPV